MKGFSIGKRFDVRAARSNSPIFDALSRSMVEFAKAGLLPSQVYDITIAPAAWDALWAEQKHTGCYEGKWLTIAGIEVHRGEG